MSLVIPIFIPHQGCPHLCLFCNQRNISGEKSEHQGEQEQIVSTIEEWLQYSKRSSAQVAFYGGSFTCLPFEKQNRMLEAVQPFISSGRVESIRLSTRPDCLDDEMCKNLVTMRVKIVELGVQSLDNIVLKKSLRGHTRDDCHRAVSLLKTAGLQVGLQLMPGLPGETTNSFLNTVHEAITLQPECVRLYPALVVKNSGLAELFLGGEFTPLTLNKAVALTRKAKYLFESAGIHVIRMGLQPSKSLEEALVAGPYHPAFGELVNARSWLQKVRKLMSTLPQTDKVEIHISPRDLSAFVGPKKNNIKRLESLGVMKNITIVTHDSMERGSMHHVVTT